MPWLSGGGSRPSETCTPEHVWLGSELLVRRRGGGAVIRTVVLELVWLEAPTTPCVLAEGGGPAEPRSPADNSSASADATAGCRPSTGPNTICSARAKRGRR